MTQQINFLLRKSTGDQPVGSEQELREWLQKGQCKPADLLFDFATTRWIRVGDHKALADLFAAKPSQIPDRKLIYFMGPGNAAIMQGPFSTKEIQTRIQGREICESTWIFVEGDKEWRQLRNVKVLFGMLTPLPTDMPAKPVEEVRAEVNLDVMPSQGDGDRASLTRALEGLEMSDDSGPLSATQSAPPPISFASAPMTAPKPAPAAAAFSLELGESASISAPESAPAAEVFSLDMGSSAPAYPPPMSFEISAPAPMPVSSPVSPPVFAPTVSPVSAPAAAAELSISFDMENPEVDREDPTMSFSALGLSLENVDVPPPKAEPPAGLAVPPVARPSVPPQPNSSPPPKPAASPAVPPPRVSLNTLAEKDTGTFDGITAQVPMDPIWLVKRGNLETVAGPFRFLEVIKLLEEGKLNKNDKISREGTNRFVKIQQQYEFNVKFVVETVVESGVERQRIVIKRRHPRVSYMTEVQIAAKGGNYVAACVNISAGGILIEMSKGEFALGEIIDIKMMPSLISKMIACKSMVIGKIPKIPPGFALKFENLKPEDKEAIEFFVNESLKREMQKNS